MFFWKSGRGIYAIRFYLLPVWTGLVRSKELATTKPEGSIMQNERVEEEGSLIHEGKRDEELERIIESKKRIKSYMKDRGKRE